MRAFQGSDVASLVRSGMNKLLDLALNHGYLAFPPFNQGSIEHFKFPSLDRGKCYQWEIEWGIKRICYHISPRPFGTAMIAPSMAGVGSQFP